MGSTRQGVPLRDRPRHRIACRSVRRTFAAAHLSLHVRTRLHRWVSVVLGDRRRFRPLGRALGESRCHAGRSVGAPFPKLQAYKTRMGWSFPWASSFGSDFNYDFAAADTKDEWESGAVEYNFRTSDFRPPAGEDSAGLDEFASGIVGTDWATYRREGPRRARSRSTTASSITPTRRTPAVSTVCGGCTSGSTAPHSVGTKPACGGTATTNTPALTGNHRHAKEVGLPSRGLLPPISVVAATAAAARLPSAAISGAVTAWLGPSNMIDAPTWPSESNTGAETCATRTVLRDSISVARYSCRPPSTSPWGCRARPWKARRRRTPTGDLQLQLPWGRRAERAAAERALWTQAVERPTAGDGDPDERRTITVPGNESPPESRRLRSSRQPGLRRLPLELFGPPPTDGRRRAVDALRRPSGRRRPRAGLADGQADGTMILLIAASSDPDAHLSRHVISRPAQRPAPNVGVAMTTSSGGGRPNRRRRWRVKETR